MKLLNKFFLWVLLTCTSISYAEENTWLQVMGQVSFKINERDLQEGAGSNLNSKLSPEGGPLLISFHGDELTQPWKLYATSDGGNLPNGVKLRIKLREFGPSSLPIEIISYNWLDLSAYKILIAQGQGMPPTLEASLSLEHLDLAELMSSEYSAQIGFMLEY